MYPVLRCVHVCLVSVYTNPKRFSATTTATATSSSTSTPTATTTTTTFTTSSTNTITRIVTTYLWPIDNFLFEGGPRQGQDIGHYGAEDEVIIAAQLGARERRHALQQQRRRPLNVSGSDKMEGLVHLIIFLCITVDD